MEIRFESSRKEVSQMNTETLRENFLIDTIFENDKISWVYSHYDRVMIGSAVPATAPLTLETFDSLKSNYFLERREIGIINIGGDGKVIADGEEIAINKMGCIYVGKGTQKVTFSSDDSSNPAAFYLLSSPAHHTYPTRLFTKEDATPITIGSMETSNHRTIYKYIHLDGIQSCQLVMGLTVLKTGSVWNTMPSHVHDRRMEAYLYFDVPASQRVLHLMGEPSETRHLWISDRQAIISPPWSIHSGCGTSNYSFIWGMAGENKDYTDMDAVAISDLK
ncbi:5-dehydro-4-deoxy-D-glucuronate isomerase [Dyadobacter frigoris]|uniref:4-deoxy-L-threo-5-hexosulose-uronate ketol-isomerase n=1 Tax=Dyadobacter frigoris TaxID=2576211 RepID=A0A4U6D3W3_9BACT|nr:5-dehydro-4-deoxy-D-glucuronate isomerase [Dyadobacter frigoris]TKT91980.1 5-dehydro-4-deoxy-D-glucuronate isomerase [Dyadobacter frigoris]GLU53145.1 4-deoxy-L-threo-5-hexosulose-uronate ketol-isomerase [Dyadobacter frigoris]